CVALRIRLRRSDAPFQRHIAVQKRRRRTPLRIEELTMRSLVLVAAAAFFSLSPADAKTIALAHVTAIDVEDGTRRDDQTLIIKDGKIVKIGPSAAVAPPAGSEIVDGSGKFLIPGLW